MNINGDDHSRDIEMNVTALQRRKFKQINFRKNAPMYMGKCFLITFEE